MLDKASRTVVDCPVGPLHPADLTVRALRPELDVDHGVLRVQGAQGRLDHTLILRRRGPVPCPQELLALFPEETAKGLIDKRKGPVGTETADELRLVFDDGPVELLAVDEGLLRLVVLLELDASTACWRCRAPASGRQPVSPDLPWRTSRMPGGLFLGGDV